MSEHKSLTVYSKKELWDTEHEWSEMKVLDGNTQEVLWDGGDVILFETYGRHFMMDARMDGGVNLYSATFQVEGRGSNTCTIKILPSSN